MARGIRFIPEGGALVEVTGRTLHGRFLLRPSQELRVITLGILARAKRMYGVRIHSFVFLSNHMHILLSVQDAKQLSDFMCYVNSNLAREAGRLYDWKEKFWGRRYQAIVVSNEEEAQIERLEYILSNSVKEGLVERPQDWPGAHSVNALLTGEPLEGLWFDRTQEYAARMRQEDFDRLRYATVEVLTLDPLPCWSGLSGDQYRERIASLVARIEAEARARRESQGKEPLGREAILAQEPHSKPVRSQKSPAPRFHAFRKSVRRELYEAYAWFVAAFKDASEKLRSGDLTAKFPPGSFPPALPFVA
jgi:REP element-mobilizing transposase RayT